MPRATPAIALGSLLALASVACVPPVATPAAAPAVAQQADPATAADAVPATWTCGPHRVELVDAGHVLVTLADGRGVSLPRLADRTPATWAGEALAFSLAQDAPVLSQDEGGHWSCARDA